MFVLDDLIPELVLLTGTFLPPRSLNALIQTSTRYAELLTPILYNKALSELAKWNRHDRWAHWKGVPSSRQQGGVDLSIPFPFGFSPHPRLWECMSNWLSLYIQRYVNSKPVGWASEFIFYRPNNSVECLLQKAVRSGNQLLVGLLVAKEGVHRKIRGEKDRMALLHIAVRSGHLDILTMLLDAGADVLSLSRNGETPLIVAINARRQELALWLIDYLHVTGEDIQDRGSILMTPLHMAARLNDVAVLKALIAKGADVDGCVTEHTSNLTAFSLALSHNSNNVCFELIELMKGDITRLSNYRYSYSDANSPTVLHFAIRGRKRSNWAAAKRLIEVGVHLDIENRRGMNAMEHALYYSAESLLESLIQSGPEVWRMVDGRGRDIHGLLRSCCRSNPIDLPQLRMFVRLYELGKLAINTKKLYCECFGEKSPLYRHVAHCNPLEESVEATQLLLKLGFSPDSETPLTWETPLEAAVSRPPSLGKDHRMEIFTLLANASSKLSHQNKAGSTVLHGASARGFVSAVQLLLEKLDQQSITKTDRNGKSALHSACMSGINDNTRAIIQLYLPLGPEVLNARTVQPELDPDNVYLGGGKTALHFIAMSNSEYAVMIMDDFRKAGANISALDDDGNPPVHGASQMLLDEGGQDNIRFFVNNNADLHLGCAVCRDAIEVSSRRHAAVLRRESRLSTCLAI